MNYRVGRVLFTKNEISNRVAEIASDIRREFSGQEVLLLGILKGCVIFISDLARAIGPEVDVRLDFMVLSSYGADTKSSGVVRIVKDLDTYIEGKNVIIVEDIVDTGLTMSYLLSILEQRKPASLKVCSLLNKGERRKVKVQLDYCGFEIPDEFVIGYGLDCAAKWRALSDICIVEPTEEE